MKRLFYICCLSLLVCCLASCEVENATAINAAYSVKQNDNGYYNRYDHSSSLKTMMQQQDREREARRIADMQNSCKYKDGGYASGAVYHPGSIPCCKTR